MKYKVSGESIKEELDLLASKDIKLKDETYNLIMLKTNKGIVKIQTTLSLEEWLKENQMKPKQQTKKKR